MKYERLERGIERFVLDEDRFGDKKCRLVLFGIYFAKQIAALDSECLSKLADKVKEECSSTGMRRELRLAVTHLSNHVTLKSCVIEAIKDAMID